MAPGGNVAERRYGDSDIWCHLVEILQELRTESFTWWKCQLFNYNSMQTTTALETFITALLYCYNYINSIINL